MHELPETRTARFGGEDIEYLTTGRGGIGVVLINGAGGRLEGWHRILAPLAALTRVFAYNRAGLGRSTKPRADQTGSHLVASLRATLAHAAFAPPYVLVGHSLGGLVANLFARRWPDEVSGVVFLEATAPEDPAAMAAFESPFQRGVKRVLDRLSPLPPAAETNHVARTVDEIAAAPPFPPVPLTVVTGASHAMAWATPAEARASRARHQLALAGLSPRGRQIIASRSGHFPQFSEPELVVEAVRAMVASDR